MKEKKYIGFSVEDFVLDDFFREWALAPSRMNNLFWESFLKEHPQMEEKTEKAKLIIQALQPVLPDISDIKLQSIYVKINPPTKTVSFKYWYKITAAVALILFTIGSIWIFNQRSDFLSHNENCNKSQKGKIILSDGSVKEFDTEKTVIRQMFSGNLTVDNDTVKIKEHEPKSRNTMNQIIIPYGKRSEITLSDGTHIRLNSGSSLTYPSTFRENSRKVYLSGEAFFEVSADKSRPFYVIVKDLEIKVLGTKFNVSAYNEDPITRTVLMEGKVSASENHFFSKEINLIPGEEIVFDKTDGSMNKKKVDVQLYTSWINGYLLFENKSITEVLKKLERYYNQKIVIEGSLSTSSFSGKLDLTNDLSTALENIAFASSLSVSKQDSVYIIK